MSQNTGTLVRWSVWANERLYDACAQLTPEDYFQPRPCAFGSIHGTLNHLLATDRIWLGRLTGEGHDVPSLDAVLCPDFDSLHQARRAEDRRLIRVIDAVAASDTDQDFHYVSMDGLPRRMKLHLLLSHLFLHHAHHRGQVHALLSQTPVAPPSLDLSYFPQD